MRLVTDSSFCFISSVNSVRLLKDILGALDFLHRNNWIHGDIKPANIGLMRTPASSSSPSSSSSLMGSIILLDLDNAIDIRRSRDPTTNLIPIHPGICGTIGYLAPEMEMPTSKVGPSGQPDRNSPTGYDARIDVWATAVTVLCVLWHGRNPLQQTRNPWRELHENISMRPSFNQMYTKVLGFVDGLGCTRKFKGVWRQLPLAR